MPLKQKHIPRPKPRTINAKVIAAESLANHLKVKDWIRHKERPDLGQHDELPGKDCYDTHNTQIPHPFQDESYTYNKKYHPDEEIMELKRQMASARHDIHVSKVCEVSKIFSYCIERRFTFIHIVQELF